MDRNILKVLLYCSGDCVHEWSYVKEHTGGNIGVTDFRCLDKRVIEKYTIVRLEAG